MNDTTLVPALEITTSRLFEGWLADHRVSFALSTYQAGAILFLGPTGDNGRMWVHMRAVERPMGLMADTGRLAVASLTQVISLINPREDAERATEPLYVPQMAWFTGDLDIHDLAFGADGKPVFVNTLFGCLATVSETHSFRPLWKPKFLSRLAAEDRCHLNGLAMENGAPAYVTAVSESDIVDGWRDHRQTGGVVIDVRSDEVICRGLSMPHSPRVHRDRLYILNAGSGEFGRVDTGSGTFRPIALCRGFARGLCFVEDYAVVGLSQFRDNKTFADLGIAKRLAAEGVEARCGLQVIDLRTGDTVHWLTITGAIQELFDVAAIPGALRPSMIGFKSDEIRRVISVEG
jgi:uncharacterized protein (TIGR03032 family)